MAWTCGNAPGVRRIGETFCLTGDEIDIIQFAALNFRVIQQKAGEWLLKQLNQVKDSDDMIQLKKENILNVDGEDYDKLFT